MKPQSFLTLNRQQHNSHVQGPEGSKDIVKIVHVHVVQPKFYESTRFFVHKEKKNKRLYSIFFSLPCHNSTMMHVHSFACAAHPGSTSECQLLRQQHHTHAQVKDWPPQRRNGWIKLFIFVFFVHINYSRSFIKCWTTDVTWTILMMTLLPSGPWTYQLHCCLCRVRKLSDLIKIS